jgi:hypothetical protein
VLAHICFAGSCLRMLGHSEKKLVAVAGACPGPRRHERRVQLIHHPAINLGVPRRCRPDPFCSSGRRFHWVSLRDVCWCFALSSHQALVVTRDARRCLRLRSSGMPGMESNPPQENLEFSSPPWNIPACSERWQLRLSVCCLDDRWTRFAIRGSHSGQRASQTLGVMEQGAGHDPAASWLEARRSAR